MIRTISKLSLLTVFSALGCTGPAVDDVPDEGEVRAVASPVVVAANSKRYTGLADDWWRWANAIPAASAASRDLPIPGSPTRKTAPPREARAASIALVRSATSRSRPMMSGERDHMGGQYPESPVRLKPGRHEI